MNMSNILVFYHGSSSGTRVHRQRSLRKRVQRVWRELQKDRSTYFDSFKGRSLGMGVVEQFCIEQKLLSLALDVLQFWPRGDKNQYAGKIQETNDVFRTGLITCMMLSKELSQILK